MSFNEPIDQYLDAAKHAARLAADVLQSWRERFQVSEKGLFDLVTDADIAAQKAIFEYLQSQFPGHHFLGEEAGASKQRPERGAPPTWIVDPLDGTTNYVHDCPLYSVSIGLQIADEMVVGVVYEPSRDEMFSAGKGHGAWLNDIEMRSSSVHSLQSSLVSTGFPADIRGKQFILKWWEHFSTRVQALRRTGSTAINLAYVAAGRFDGFWAFDNNVWDVAGGMVLVREAGGVITNVDGSPYDPYTPDALAGARDVHAMMLAEFSSSSIPISGNH